MEAARANPPEDMPYDNWQKTIDHFISEKYQARCAANKEVRQRQVHPNRGGTATLSSTAFKNVILYIYIYKYMCVCVF